MKKPLILLLAFVAPFVLSNCTLSVTTQRNTPGVQVKTTTEKTTTNRPQGTSVETQTTRAYY
jgi:hypothetical protein